MSAAASTGSASTMSPFKFDSAFTREETLHVLSTFGVDIPKTSKLPDESLQKRLRQAINASQAMSSINPKPPLALDQYSKWPRNSKTLYDSIRRGNFEEAALGGNSSPLYVNAFMDVRQTLMSLAVQYEKGIKYAIIQDKQKEKCAINIRIPSIYRIDQRTPLLLILYKSVDAADPMPGIRWLQELMNSGKNTKSGLPNVTATELEQKLLLMILDMNAKRLPPNTVVERMKSETEFKLSFLLPMGPLGYDDIGKLNLNTGCVVCGGDIASRCSQCQSVSYCGKECQLADWPTHKATCRSLKGGAWHTMPFATTPPGMTGMIGAIFNRHDTVQSMSGPEKLDGKNPPSNVHGDKMFLIKVQSNGSRHFLIYDRKRTFTIYLIENEAPAVFRKFEEEISGPRGQHHGGSMYKMYRWAKRVSDWELSVCLDKEPQADIKW